MSTAREILPGVSIHPQMIETRLGKVEYDITGDKGTVIIASHGGFGGVDQARLLLSWLDPSQYRLLSVSRPGYLGTPLASGQTIEAQADLFAALLDALAIEQVAVVTLSAGGPTGYQFAIRYPNRVRALIAIASVSGHYTMPETAGVITQNIIMSQPGMKLMKMLGQMKPDWLLRQVLQGVAYYNQEQLQTHIDYALNSPDALVFVQALMSTLNPYKSRLAGTNNDSREFCQLEHIPVGNITCPCLIIHGTHDADVKFYDAVYAYENIANAERYWIEEGSHLGFWISPHAPKAQAIARRFLQKHHPSS